MGCSQCAEGPTAPVGHSQPTGTPAAAAVGSEKAQLVLVSKPCETLCLFSADASEA